MNWWRVLRVAFLLGCLAVGLFAPEAWLAVAGVRLLVTRLGVYGLLGEQFMFEEQQHFQQEKSLKEMYEKSRPLLDEREMLILLEGFTSTVPDAV